MLGQARQSSVSGRAAQRLTAGRLLWRIEEAEEALNGGFVLSILPADRKSMDHPEIINRLERADGRPIKIITMLERRRPCPQFAHQLEAIKRRDRECQEGADPRSYQPLRQPLA